MSASTDSPTKAQLDPSIGKPQKLSLKLILRIVWSMLRRRWWLMGISFVIALVAGAFGSKPVTEKVWKASALLLYTAPRVPDSIGTIAKSVELANMSGFVTSYPVLSKVNDALGGTFPVPLLEKSISVETSRMTKTLFLALEWGDKDECQKLLDQVVTEYPKYIASVRQSIAQGLLDELNQQIAATKTRLNASRTRLRDFLRENNIVDFDQDIVLKQAHVLSLETSIASLKRDGVSLVNQLAMLDKQVESLRQEAQEEAEADAKFEAANESLSDNRRRQNRLRELIEEERRILEVRSKIEQLRTEYERAKALASKKLIPVSQLEAVRSQLLALISQVTESTKIKKWQTELEDLDKMVVPTNKNAKKSSPIIAQILSKKLEAELKIAHGEQSLIEIERELEATRLQIASFQAKRNDLRTLQDEVTGIVDELASLQAKSGELLQLASLGPVEFTVISPAATGEFPVSSNRKKMFAGIALVTILLSGTSIAAFDVLLCGIIPTDAQVEMLGLPILSRPEEPLYDAPESVLQYGESVRKIAFEVRRWVPDHGSVLLLSCMTESTRFVPFVEDLAECYARRDERILILDARQVADGIGEFADVLRYETILDQVDRDWDVSDIFLPGLSDWLTMRVSDLAHVIHGTTLPGTDLMLPGSSCIGEEYATLRMRELMETVRSSYSIILMIGPATELKNELQILGTYVDGIALSFEATERLNTGVSESIETLVEMQSPLIGAVQL